MNVLILGSGGREHAFAWKISQSALCNRLYVAPGNPGIQDEAFCLPVAIDDFKMIARTCIDKKIDLLVVGPEVPLVAGIRDFLLSQKGLEKLLIVGPDKSGARLEGSKDFSKSFMLKYKIPTATSKTFTISNLPDAKEYIKQQKPPIVLKADGLAAGKGVIIAESFEEATNSIEEMLTMKKFGDASRMVLVEQFLKGIELSVFVLTDGKGGYVVLPEAKDYKRIGEGDTGLNTGGMGAISPVVLADNEFMK
ncbi:MAG: phosphoribosylamine--glycine ligase, partial [Cytophagales bacterium]